MCGKVGEWVFLMVDEVIMIIICFMTVSDIYSFVVLNFVTKKKISLNTGCSDV